MTMLCQLNKKCINYLIDRLARIVQIRKRISVSKKSKIFMKFVIYEEFSVVLKIGGRVWKM